MRKEADKVDGRIVGQIYDQQAKEYSEFSENSYTWNFIEKPAFDFWLKDFYRFDVKVLDLGCGDGRLIKHLISRGIIPENIVGIDVSNQLLAKAKKDLPQVTFVQSSSKDINFPKQSFDLVTANMVFHHMDNIDLLATFDKVHKVLKKNGVLFFVDTDPYHIGDDYDLNENHGWVEQKTPWGTSVPAFNRYIIDFLFVLHLSAFEIEDGVCLEVIPEGEIDSEKYLRYKAHPSRIATIATKRSLRTKYKAKEARKRYIQDETREKENPSLVRV